MPEIKTPRFRCATDGALFQVQQSFAQRLALYQLWLTVWSVPKS